MPLPNRLLHDLEHSGWTMSDDILPAELAHQLLTLAQQRWERAAFHEARIGPALAQRRDTRIRGDDISWLEPHDPHPAVAQFQRWAEQLRLTLDAHFRLGLKWLECHFARYDSGAGYARHVDQHAASGARKISVVIYLNPDWRPGDGGELCLYDPEQPERETAHIDPLMGRLILMRSDLVPHAVLPCRNIRWSLTGWLRSDQAPPPNGRDSTA